MILRGGEVIIEYSSSSSFTFSLTTRDNEYSYPRK